MDIAVLYRFSPKNRIGLMVKNIGEFYASDDSPKNTPENAGFSLPVDTTLGASFQYRGFLLSLDNELIDGHYGGTESKKTTFWFVRAGIEKELNDWLTLRCGLTIPMVARTDTLGNIRNNLPWPKMGGAFGFSTRFDHLTFDFAVYGDPAQSYVDQKIRINTVGSLTIIY